jgi:hypothetical protein
MSERLGRMACPNMLRTGLRARVSRMGCFFLPSAMIMQKRLPRMGRRRYSLTLVNSSGHALDR